MTSHKHFKSRVRTRMQKTGESYTTARMHLVAGRDPSVPGLVQEYPPLEPLIQYDAGLWQRVLAQAGTTHPVSGLPFTEAFLAGLAGGIGFMVFTFEYQQITTATVVTRFHPGPYVDNLLTRSGAHVDRLSTTSPKIAQRNLDAALEQGRAAMVRVTRGSLPWIPDEPEFSDSVDLVVAGYDGETYALDDGGSDIRRIAPADLATARARRTKDKHWQASITDPGDQTRTGLTKAVTEAVTETIAVLLGDGTQQEIPSHVSRNFGVAGLTTWAERLRDTRTKKGWPSLFATEERLRPALIQLKNFLSGNEWAGEGGLRPLYAQFLAEAAELDGLEPLKNSVADYENLGAAWSDFANLIDPKCPPSLRNEHFAALADHLDRLAASEQAAAESLRARLRQL